MSTWFVLFHTGTFHDGAFLKIIIKMIDFYYLNLSERGFELEE